MGNLYKKILDKEDISIEPKNENLNFANAAQNLMKKIEEIMKNDEDYDKVKDILNLKIIDEKQLISGNPSISVIYRGAKKYSGQKF